MAQPALFEEQEARLITGRVIGLRGNAFHVLAGNVRHEAVLAASCLLEPRESDIVLLAGLENSAAVILSVLYRDETTTAHLRLPQNSAIECPGRLAVRSAMSLDLQSGKALRLETEDLSVSAMNASATVTRLNTVADTARLCCRSLTTLGQNAIATFRTLTQCLGESRRMVEGADETRCQSSTLVAEESATVMSKNSLNLSKETSRTDAKLIQLG